MAVVLFVDDEQSLRRAVQRWMSSRGVTVHTAKSVASAKRCLATHDVDGAFLDIWLGQETGFDLYSWIQEHQPGLTRCVVFLTGDVVRTPNAEQRLRAIGRPVLGKPFDLEELERYARSWATRREAAPHRDRAAFDHPADARPPALGVNRPTGPRRNLDELDAR